MPRGGVIVEADQFGPGHYIGRQDDPRPCGVASAREQGQATQAGGLGLAGRVLDSGALTKWGAIPRQGSRARLYDSTPNVVHIIHIGIGQVLQGQSLDAGEMHIHGPLGVPHSPYASVRRKQPVALRFWFDRLSHLA